MKQIIGFIKYDYMNIKYGIWYILVIFGVASIIFSMQSGMGAVSYMLFGGLILAGTTFGVTKQAVSFTALVPGTILQKVVSRYLGNILCIMACIAEGLLSFGIARLTGADNGKIEWSGLFVLFGVTLFFLAIQNVLLYLLTPFLGIQFISLVRMIPGFILFFLVMNAGRYPDILQSGKVMGRAAMGLGAASLAVSMFLSCMILQKRDNE